MPVQEQEQQQISFVEELSDRLIALSGRRERLDFQVQGYLIHCIWFRIGQWFEEGGLEVTIPGANVYFSWESDEKAMESLTTRNWRHGGHGDLGKHWLEFEDLGLIRRAPRQQQRQRQAQA